MSVSRKKGAGHNDNTTQCSKMIVNSIIVALSLVFAVVMIAWCFYTEHHYTTQATVTDSIIDSEVYCVDETDNYWAFYTDRPCFLIRGNTITLCMDDNGTTGFKLDDKVVDYKIVK